MRAKTIWRAGLLALILATMPGLASAQGSLGYAPADVVLPIPYGSSQPEHGGPFVGLEFILFRQTNPLHNQQIAQRGFYDINAQSPADGGALFFGSGAGALDTNQLRGPGSYQPGFKAHLGYRFVDESTLTLSWMHLFQIRHQAVATPAPANFNLRPDFSDSFLTANVYNFPNAFAGPPSELGGLNGAAAYGIWNGASLMTIDFVQRTEAFELIWRKPIVEEENYRFSSLLGPRFFWIWERFKWLTTDFGFADSDGPSALYTNIVSNRMYGWNFGCSQECYLGHGFALMLDTNAAAYLDIVKTRVKYRTNDKYNGVQNKRGRTDYTVVPEIDAKLSVMWYPTENVQFQFGYNVMMFFNTVASERPVDFDYSSVSPKFNREFRIFDGLSAAIAITF